MTLSIQFFLKLCGAFAKQNSCHEILKCTYLEDYLFHHYFLKYNIIIIIIDINVNKMHLLWVHLTISFLFLQIKIWLYMSAIQKRENLPRINLVKHYLIKFFLMIHCTLLFFSFFTNIFVINFNYLWINIEHYSPILTFHVVYHSIWCIRTVCTG